MRRVLQTTVLALIFTPAALAAQVCLGRPALVNNSKANLGAGVSFFDGGKGFNAQATYGGPLFVFAGFEYLDFDDTDFSFKTIGGGVGYEARTSDGNITICPTGSIIYGFGLEILGIDFTSLQFVPALAAGFTAEVSPTVRATPFAEVGFVYSRLTADAGPIGDDTETDTAGLLRLGLGLIFNQRLSIRPMVTIPISEDDGDTIFGVEFSVAIGR